MIWILVKFPVEQLDVSVCHLSFKPTMRLLSECCLG